MSVRVLVACPAKVELEFEYVVVRRLRLATCIRHAEMEMSEQRLCDDRKSGEKGCVV